MFANIAHPKFRGCIIIRRGHCGLHPDSDQELAYDSTQLKKKLSCGGKNMRLSRGASARRYPDSSADDHSMLCLTTMKFPD
jgi:hypothetical protein